MAITTQNYSPVVTLLQKQLSDDTELEKLLNKSLNLAKQSAQASLNASLFNALNTLYKNNGWPTNSDDYLSYLTYFEQVLPSESIELHGPWSNPLGYSQQIFDRLCQFYWLIDQPLPDYNKKTLQSYTNDSFSFADWLDKYANEWGSFLNTSASLTNATLATFLADPMYNAQDYINDKPNWVSFNTFFYRQLNINTLNGSPMRPIANPNDNTIVTSPADCTFKAIYQIDANGNVLDTNGNLTTFRLKQTHTIGNVNDLLGPDGEQYASQFYNGTFVHYFLSPFDYHRFHTPVSGKVKYIEALSGSVFLDVQITGDQFDAPDSSTDGYEFTQARGVVIIDTGDASIGSVATIPVGMAQVSSVHMYSNLAGQTVNKGTEFGYFAFGGSDIIMLFEKPVDQLKFVETVANAQVPDSYTNPAGFHFKYGEPSVIIQS
ncbi:phosphatidylserine decarboxylase [Emticicia sp. 21SJ11W-3]|uniref:phosphatidylserine decarboxylase n=1 Tax=Emticicia sp. 21SJ11W-3 TaxID=2916755 RepID=UPI00209D28AA|nr:phosphatidylserine decarboxylase [Emticicia sp. 21SJ11W-3]UTA66194.1 phosphatidylserine decarboxylase [Emticicia sp. 21SJ11W-3]